MRELLCPRRWLDLRLLTESATSQQEEDECDESDEEDESADDDAGYDARLLEGRCRLYGLVLGLAARGGTRVGTSWNLVSWAGIVWIRAVRSRTAGIGAES